LGERHLRRILARYFEYYHRARTHLSLDKDAPDARAVELSDAGRIVEIPEVGGLHHRYVRRAAWFRTGGPHYPRTRFTGPVLPSAPRPPRESRVPVQGHRSEAAAPLPRS